MANPPMTLKRFILVTYQNSHRTHLLEYGIFLWSSIGFDGNVFKPFTGCTLACTFLLNLKILI